MKFAKSLMILAVLALAVACGDSDENNTTSNNTAANANTGTNNEVPTDVVRSSSLVNVDEATPSATGDVSIRRDDDGTMYVYLGENFVQEMGPGDTEVRLATAGGNVDEQLEADPASVTDAIGVVPNGGTGEYLFEIPAGVTQADFSHVIIWCPTAGINFGVADLGGDTGNNSLASYTATLTNVDGTPSATGAVTITETASGEFTIALGDDFVQEMGPGDTEIRLAAADTNVGDQIAADSASVSDSLGIVPNETSGALEFTVSGIDPAAFSYVIIWCPTASVNFGVGELQ